MCVMLYAAPSQALLKDPRFLAIFGIRSIFKIGKWGRGDWSPVTCPQCHVALRGL